MALNEQEWYTEVQTEAGIAYSLRITRRLHEEQTPFQHIAVYETTRFGRLLVIDGCMMLTERDNFLYHEMLTHPALFTHPDPRDVLIIGGGDCGTLREVLRHASVRKADMVEIDARVTRVAEEYFPELCSANADPRAHIHFADGIRWTAEAAPQSYDLIIVDSTDPVGPAAGLFAAPFYGDCRKALRPDGIFVQQSESPLLHGDLICDVHQRLRGAGFGHTHTLSFPQPCYPSGWWSATLASAGTPLTQFRTEAVRTKPFATVYYNADVHRGALAVPEFLRRQLAAP